MGTFEGDENRNRSNSNQKNSIVDSFDASTRQIDSQFSPGGAFKGDRDDDFLNTMNMLPFGDTYLLEDEFETQLANLAEETQMVDLVEDSQVMDLDGETQLVDFAGETQMVDPYEETQVVDLPGDAQVLDEFNAELDIAECRQTNKTDIMCETQKLSEDDSAKIDGSVSVELESTMDKDPPKKESPCRGFTSIRAASIRASGLAAHARGVSRGLSTTSTDKSSLEQQTSELDVSSIVGHMSKSGRKSDREFLENDGESESNSNKHKNGSTAVRKLFGEDEDAKVDESETEINHRDDNLDMPELLAAENSVAGLSYAASQEPGELSQARALEVVDRFLDLSFIELDEDFGKKVRNVEKPKVVSAAKGSRDLAKKTTLQNTVGEGGIYDWDDAREDDGGGEFFLKKKELFFENEGPKKRRCLTEPRKSKCVRDSDKKEKQRTRAKLGNLVYSDSGLLHKSRSKQKSLHGEEVPQKNLIKNMEEQLNKLSEPELSDNGPDEDVPDVRNIGPDTQMAAEAMGDLCFEVHLADDNNSGDKGVYSTRKAARQNKLRNTTDHSEEHLPYPTCVGVVTRQAKRTKRISTRNSSESSLSPNQCIITMKRDDRVLGEAERKLAAVNVHTRHGDESTGRRSEKSCMEDKLDFSVPVAHRTRKSTKSCSKIPANSANAGGVTNDLVSARACRKKTAARDKNAVTMTIEEVRKVGLARLKQSNKTCLDKSSTSDIKLVANLQGKSSMQKTSADTWHNERLKRSSEVAASIPRNPDRDHSNHSPPSLDSESRKIISRKIVNARNSKNDAALCGSGHLNLKSIPNDAVGISTSKLGDEKSYDEASTGGAERSGRQEVSPRCGTRYTTCATPAIRTTLRPDVSPICMGDEYHKQSCRKNLSAVSLIREIDDLRTGSPGPYGRMRESRKRKDITTIRVLFSQHLDEDVVKQQKKILARLGGAVASSMLDATHFVADEFVRTRNMLEAIASGKPVVTHLWIECCGQASCLIDEKNYILRDAKKEKEFSFCLPVSLARASRHPLLQGQKVFVTPNTKPGKDILANLIKAVHGLPIERLGRSVFKDEQLPDDLLILSCEEDYDACVPFLEKGGAIYSSELLLNGIVKQKLEFERHGLFADHVKRTRSTIWLRKTNKFLPVKK